VKEKYMLFECAGDCIDDLEWGIVNNKNLLMM